MFFGNKRKCSVSHVTFLKRLFVYATHREPRTVLEERKIS